jgi:hypothetical protein
MRGKGGEESVLSNACLALREFCEEVRGELKIMQVKKQ